MMNEREFERLWERAEAESHASMLAAEYPAWRQKQRRTTGIVAGIALVAVAGIFTFNYQFSNHQGYDYVACNRSGIADSHWAGVAANILISNCEI